jgi:hypothetical protein
MSLNLQRTVDDKFINEVEYALKDIPEHLIQFVRDSGTKLYLLDKSIKPSYIGLDVPFFIDISGLGRSCDDTSCVIYNTKNKKSEIRMMNREHSSIRHEFGHAIDFNLDFISEKHDYKGTPLDWYAGLNTHERFAQAFDAYFTYKENPNNEFIHTKKDLLEREPELYKLIDSIVCGNFISNI